MPVFGPPLPGLTFFFSSLVSDPPHDGRFSLGYRVLGLWLLVIRWCHPLPPTFRPIPAIISYVPGLALPFTLLSVLVCIPVLVPISSLSSFTSLVPLSFPPRRHRTATGSCPRDCWLPVSATSCLHAVPDLKPFFNHDMADCPPHSLYLLSCTCVRLCVLACPRHLVEQTTHRRRSRQYRTYRSLLRLVHTTASVRGPDPLLPPWFACIDRLYLQGLPLLQGLRAQERLRGHHLQV